MRYRTLGKTGALVSVIGFGASPLGDVFGRIEPMEAERTVQEAVGLGINLFDVSPYYGATLAESRLGRALQGRRSAVLLATKCGRYGLNEFDFSAARIRRGIDESLTRLQTDYVDLLQAHDIEFADERQIVEETVPALLEIQRSGKARWIGVTGYPLGMLSRVARAAPIDVVLSYCRYNLLNEDLRELLLPVARDKHLGLLNASPLHMGILSGTDVPSWHPAAEAVRQAGTEVVSYCAAHDLAASVIALRFCLDNPAIASTLVGMATEEHLRRNLQALETEIDPSDLEAIRQIAQPVQGLIWPSGRPENADQPVSVLQRS